MQYDQIVFLSFWLMITDQMFVRIKSWCKKILIFHLWIIFHDKMSQMKSKSITDDARKRREKNQKNFQLTIHKNSDELSCRSIGWGWNEFFGSCLHSNAWGHTLEGERFWNHDVDWGGDTVDRKSKTRFVVYVRGDVGFVDLTKTEHTSTVKHRGWIQSCHNYNSQGCPINATELGVEL